MYTHCAIPRAEAVQWGDSWGLRGDPSCRGVPAGAIYGCAEWHNASSQSTVFMRNFCEGVLWVDDVYGPGDNQFFFGNWLAQNSSSPERGKVTGAQTFNTAPGEMGSLGLRYFFPNRDPGFRYCLDVGIPYNCCTGPDEGASCPGLVIRDWHFHNNIFEGDLGQSNRGFDTYGDGTTITDNVIGGSCYKTGFDDGGCTGVGGERPGVNVTIDNNTIGDDVHPATYNRTMPSLPGFTAWPEFSVIPQGSAPYIGPELGNPDLLSAPCLPATQRNGLCP